LTVVGLLRLALAAVLLGSAAAKLAAGERGRRALASYGLQGRAATAAWAGTIVLEAVLGIAVAAGVPGSAEAAAVLLGLFTVLLVVAIARGRTGQPCGCFGNRSRIGWGAAVRSAGLAVAFAVLPFLPDTSLSTEALLGAGLGVALVGVAALAVALLALAREVGELRIAVAPQSALSLDHEGPELGGRVGLIERFERRSPLAVAVFTSPGCSLCAALEPSLRLLERDPEVELHVFDEHEDAEAWESLGIPGSPYAVVLAATDGEVLSKGTFNSLYQLESLLGPAAARA
jgi:hypothetical protein